MIGGVTFRSVISHAKLVLGTEDKTAQEWNMGAICVWVNNADQNEHDSVKTLGLRRHKPM